MKRVTFAALAGLLLVGCATPVWNRQNTTASERAADLMECQRLADQYAWLEAGRRWQTRHDCMEHRGYVDAANPSGPAAGAARR